MFIQQLSVFLENREGRLEQLTKILAENDINIICISLADTSDYGMLRMIVSDVAKAEKSLKANGFSSMITEVIGVKLPHHFGMLNKLSRMLSEKDINIEYMYALTSGKDNASIIIKTSDNKQTLALIQNSELALMPPETAYNL